MFMIARAGGIGLFSSFSRAVGVILYLVVSFIIMIMLRMVAISLSTALTEPIYELQDAMKKLKDGNFDIELTYEDNDELSDLGSDILAACNQLHIIVADTGEVLEKMAGGNFKVSTSARESYVGDFQNQLNAMRTLKYNLSDTLRQIQAAAAQVMVGSEQLADNAQVEMLKQIEAGIDQINLVVQSNSATAQETSAVSEELSAQATGLDEMIEKFELK